MKTRITKIFTFDAAHKLDNHDGKCRHLHGHTYKLEVTVTGGIRSYYNRSDPQGGMIIDFGVLKQIVNKIVLDQLDHSNLNDHFGYTTAEVMADSIFIKLKGAFELYSCPDPPQLELPFEHGERDPNSWLPAVELVRIRLWETPTSYAEVIQ